jgi:P27 family predicted phage terminase small subunit
MNNEECDLNRNKSRAGFLKMGKRGPAPYTAKLKLLKGTRNRPGQPENIPEPELKIPKAPKGISKAAKKEWKRIGKLLADVGVISETDQAALAMYCETYSAFLDLSRKLDKEGIIIEEKKLDKDGAVIKGSVGIPRVNPLLLVRDRLSNQLRQIMSELGITPASRTRVAGTKPKSQEKSGEEKKNKLSDLVNGG